jgi:outer membrane protein insertion porin family
VGSLTGCVGTKHLKENEKLLIKQKIKTPSSISKSDLRELYAQEANQRFPPFLIPLHYAGKRRFSIEKYEKKKQKAIEKIDAKIAKTKRDRRINNLQFKKQRKIDKYNNRIEDGNLWMQWGEPIAVFDSLKFEQTIERFQNYLFSKGYFDNEVIGKIEPGVFPFSKKTVKVLYEVNPNKAYFLDSIFYKVSDSTIYKLITKRKDLSHLQEGQRYEQSNFTKERERLDILMKDNGYFDFSRQYIEFEIDTSFLADHRIAVMVVIKEPAKRGYHKKFYINKVNFIPDASTTVVGVERTTESYRNIDFKYFNDNYNLKILSQRVFLKPGQSYSRDNTFTTQRQLANLDNFKFVNINYDTAGGNFIANIFTSPFDRYQWSNEFGVSVTQGYPGPFYNINFKKRNIFNGLENFELNGRMGFEGVASATQEQNVYRSTEASINSSITFPQFLFPFSETRRNTLARLNPRTRASIGYTYTNRPEYKRTSTNLNLTYSWENKRIRRFDFTLSSLSIINSNTTTAFQKTLDSLATEGNNLYLSFRPSFVSSMIFSMSWNHNNYGNREENSVFFRWSVESGGTLQNLIDYPAIENRGLQSFKYIRLNADIRRLNIIDRNTNLAYRLNAGVAYSYDTVRALPYEKYFFAGGSNSIRAWRPRRLGPGSFRPDSSSTFSDGLFSYQFEKPGDVLLEASVELRRKIIGFIEGAVFLDAGNVWTIKPQEKRNEQGNTIENGNSQFKVDQFYKEIAIGTGFGLRFNFSFLILRFDVGIKVWDPARLEGDRFVLNKMKFFGPFGPNREPVIYNVGIGYPF